MHGMHTVLYQITVFSRVRWLLSIEVTNHARSAMLHFYTPNISTHVDRVVKSFFVSSYIVHGQKLVTKKVATSK